jgi:hypothetical protein
MSTAATPAQAAGPAGAQAAPATPQNQPPEIIVTESPAPAAPSQPAAAPAPAVQPAAPAAVPAPAKAETADDRAARLEKENADLRKEAAARRVQAKKAQEDALVKEGNYKALADLRAKEADEARAATEAKDKELEELRKLKADREAEAAAAQQKRGADVDAQIAKLPDHVRAAIPAAATLEMKEVVLAAYSATPGGVTPARPAAPPTSPPPPASGVRIYTEDELEAMSLDEYEQQKADIGKARREGRVRPKGH